MKVSENTSVDMPLKNLISIIGAVAIGVWAYFGIIERLNTLETDNHLIKKDLCVSGGLFANVKLNQKLYDIPNLNNLFVMPNLARIGAVNNPDLVVAPINVN